MKRVLRMTPEAYEVMVLAHNGTGPGETDQVLADAIMEAAAGSEAALVDALKALPVDGTASYHVDRGRRVLTGLSRKERVQPPAAEMRDLFDEEQQLEEAPHREALDVLCKREPALERAIEELVSESAVRPAGRRLMRFRIHCNRRLRSIVGPEGRSSDPLVASPVALRVTAQAFNEMMGWRTSPGT